MVVVADEDLSLRRELDLEGCRVVMDPRREQGTGRSAQDSACARSTVPTDAWRSWGDQPLLTTATIDHLVWAFSQHPDFWIVPVIEDMRGAPITAPAAWFPRLLELDGDAPASTLIASRGLWLRLVKVDHPGPFIDIDTEVQYRQLLRRHEPRSSKNAA